MEKHISIYDCFYDCSACKKKGTWKKNECLLIACYLYYKGFSKAIIMGSSYMQPWTAFGHTAFKASSLNALVQWFGLEWNLPLFFFFFFFSVAVFICYGTKLKSSLLTFTPHQLKKNYYFFARGTKLLLNRMKVKWFFQYTFWSLYNTSRVK